MDDVIRLTTALIVTMTTLVTRTSTATSTAHYRHTKELTCYTCRNHTTNGQCNKVAIDTPCQEGLGICYTEHHIDLSTNGTRLVFKSCVASCPSDTIGCTRGAADSNTPDSTLLKCVSCCRESYCNRPAPANQSHALLLSSSMTSRGSAIYRKAERTTLTYLAAVILTLFIIHRHTVPGSIGIGIILLWR